MYISQRESKTKRSDFETAIQEAGFGKFNYIMVLISIPASGTSALAIGTMSFVIPVAGSDLDLTPMTKALLQSAPLAGMICSAFIWGAFSDSYGRKNLIAGGFILDFIMNTLCAAIPHWIPILIFKFLSGFMVCGPYSIFAAYLSEVFPYQKRDLAVLSYGIFAAVVQCLQVGLAYLVIPIEPHDWLPLKSWQLFIFFCGIPSLISGISSVFTVESPKFLAEKGKTDEALEICKTIYALNTGNSRDSYPVKKIYASIGFEDKKEKKSVVNEIMAATSAFKTPYVSRLLMMFAMQVASVITVNLILLWLPEILTTVANANPEVTNKTDTLCPLLVSGYEEEAVTSHVNLSVSVYYDMFVLQVCNIFTQLIFVFVVKYVGKKNIIMVIGFISMICVITIPYTDSENVFIPSAITVSIQDVVFFALLGLMVEIFPTCVRATSVSLTMMVGRIGVLIANFFMANLMYSYCEYIFYVLALLCFSVLIVSGFLNTTPIEAPKK